MGYRVKPQKSGFKVLFEVYKDGVRTTKGIPKAEWGRLGLRPGMPLSEAKERARILNLGEKAKREEETRLRIKQRLVAESISQSHYLPASDIEAFEAERISAQTSKQRSHWNQCKRILARVQLSVSDWEQVPERFYTAFIQFKMSPAYIQKCVTLLNLWGAWYARRYKLPFLPLPRPKGHWQAKIAEQHYNKAASRGNKASDPLTPELLAASSGLLKPEQHLWLEFSVWFGLRPIEVDQLEKPTSKRTWYLTREHGATVLWIYQTKLKGVHPDKRTKYIPCITREQQALVKKLGQPIQRPLQKTMRKLFPGVTLYGGRKNFTALMKSLDQPFELISSWLGHTSLDRTYSSYFDKREVRFKKIA